MIALPPAVPLTSSAPEGLRAATSSPSVPSIAPSETVSRAPQVTQVVTIVPISSRSDLLTGTENWGWSELRDYVVAQIVERFGPFPRDARKEYGIFSRFLNQYGQDGIAVAKFAFGPACDGWWGRAPISINRFAKGSDPYFALPILERLADQ